MPSTRSTLADVARHAGVSEITVSRVVRNKGYIAQETRERVRAAIEALGYVPNRAAGALASSASLLIGVILPSLSNIVFPEVMRGIHAGLAGSGYQPLLGITDYNLEREQEILFSLMAWQPMAIITTGFNHTAATQRALEGASFRVAELMDTDSIPVDMAVGLSHRRAGYDAARHLIGRGYRRLGYVGHDWTADQRAWLRYEGIRDALRDAGLSLAGEQRYEGPSSTLAGRDMTGLLLERVPEIDAIAYSNDDLAVGGYFHCVTHGIAVRERLGLFGFNGLDIGQAIPARLSTIRSNRFLIGKLAAEALLVSGTRPAERQTIDTGYEIIEGETA